METQAGGEGGGGGTAVVTTTAATTGDYKFEFKDPEIRENFPKMFPGMKSVEDLAKTAIHQQRKIGQQGVQLPAKPEEFATWAQTHLKAPKEGKGYNFENLKIPEGISDAKAALPAFAETFAKAGMTQAQVDTVLGAYYELAGSEQAGGLVKRNELASASKLALEKKWGVDAPKKLASAEMALATLGSPELVKLVGETGLGNHAHFVEFLANAAELMKEDPATGKLSAGGFASGSQQASQEIDMLYANKEFRDQYYNPNDSGHAQAQARMQRLYKIKHREIGRK